MINELELRVRARERVRVSGCELVEVQNRTVVVLFR